MIYKSDSSGLFIRIIANKTKLDVQSTAYNFLSQAWSFAFSNKLACHEISYEKANKISLEKGIPYLPRWHELQDSL